MAFATLAIAYFSYATLGIVKTGSTQTDHLVEYAQQQSEAAAKIATAADQFKQSVADLDLHGKDAVAAMRDTTKKIDAANRQSEESFKRTVERAEVTDRAWIAVTINPDTQLIDPKTKNAATTRFEFRIVFSNSGRTPAQNVRMVSETDMFPLDTDRTMFTLPLPAFDKQKFTHVQDIFPNSQDYGDDGYDIESDTYQALTSGVNTIFVWGQIDYDDVFGHPHWLRFCQYRLRGGAFGICKGNNYGETEQQKFSIAP